ncbi:hypothetical protein niasHS_010299 [Heterodera schachtii]|uniref:Uncharacterized protein n=1 Tax=Heterodera schachtii TaxID=97005 RepID=A0ABD2J535_HETSC
MFFLPSLPLFVDQPPAKAPRHYLPFSLSEWDVRLRRADANDDNANNEKENCRWKMTTMSRKRSRSWSSTEGSRCWSSTEAATGEVSAAITLSKLPSGDERRQTQNDKDERDSVYYDDNDDDEASSHAGRSSFYIRFFNSLALRRSYDDRRRPPCGSAAAVGKQADDATSLDTWLSRRRHRRRDGFNLTKAVAAEGNGNSRFVRLVSSSFGKLREVLSLSAGCGSLTKSTAEEEKGKKRTAPPEGTFNFDFLRQAEEERKTGTAPPEGTFNFDFPRQAEEERKTGTAPSGGTFNFDSPKQAGEERKNRTAPSDGTFNFDSSRQAEEERKMGTPTPEGTFNFDFPRQAEEERKTGTAPTQNANANFSLPRDQHQRWLRYQMMLIECGGEEQNDQENAIREMPIKEERKANGMTKSEKRETNGERIS